MIINHSTHLYLKFETSWLLSSKLAADSLKFLHTLNEKKGPKISQQKNYAAVAQLSFSAYKIRNNN